MTQTTEEDFEFDPEAVEFQAKDIAAEMVENMDVPEDKKQEAIEALEFGVLATQIVLENVEEGNPWEPFSLTQEFAKMYVLFQNAKAQNEQ